MVDHEHCRTWHWPAIMLLAVYGLPLAGCAAVAWLAWRVVRRG
jgi:hypothetical protein